MKLIDILINFLITLYIITWASRCLISFLNKENFVAMSIQNSIGKNCCLVNKVFDEKKNNFVYQYKKLNSCKSNDLRNTHMHNIFIDNVNNWSNSNCQQPETNKEILGSCKNVNFECKDFMTKEECQKFNMEWYKDSCQAKYNKPFQIKPHQILINGKIQQL